MNFRVHWGRNRLETKWARILKLDFDLHYRQVNAGMQEDGGSIGEWGI
ncbi:MAG TPA: hypothetical protein VE860_00125 [Chthoniobacterales bacterium]|jgi:hypothetical protein|nr:hypothetical protein [Chthoniobacterales bacterium]